MRILITGANGLLGPYLVEAFKGHTVYTTTRAECELTTLINVKSMIWEVEPDVVIHAAAATNVEKCEQEPYVALADNRDATDNLAASLPPEAKLVYISTDMVYGDIPGPHREEDVAPVNMYGRSKLAGEKCAAANPRHLILRTSFFGPSRSPGRVSFSDFVLESLTNGRTAIFYNDVWFTPLHMQTLSTLICGLVEKDVKGIYNIGARSGFTKAEFATRLAVHQKIQFKQAIGPSHYGVKRPKDLRLDCTRLAEQGFVMPTLEEEVRKL